jgi:hypothetical protein
VPEQGVAYEIDRAVSQILTTYDPDGRVDAVISSAPADGPYDPQQSNLDPTAAGVTTAQLIADPLARNFVRYTYNDLGQILTLRQSADGPDDAPADERRREFRSRYTLTDVPYPAASGETGVVFQRADETEIPDATPDNSGDETHLKLQYTGPVDSVIGRASALALQDGAGAANVIARYSRLGIGPIAVTDLPQVGVQADRTIDSQGNRDYGTYGSTQTHGHYGGWDRFGRLVRSSWVGPGYGALTNPPTANTRQPLWQQTYSYDLLSRKLAVDDARTKSGYIDQDWRNSYDGLDRLTQSRRGRASGAAFAEAVGGRTWTLDELGNWTGLEISNGTPQPDGEYRAHNSANQLTAINQVYRFYDPAGNLIRTAAHPLGGAFIRQQLAYDA